MSHGALIGCCRIDRMPDPHVPSVEANCADCGRAVWLSINTRAAVIALEGELPPLICEICMPGRIAGVSRS